MLFFFAGKPGSGGSAFSSLYAIQLALIVLLALLLAVPDGAYRGLLLSTGVWDHLLRQLAPAAAFVLLSVVLSSLDSSGKMFHRVKGPLALAQLLSFAWFSSRLFYSTIGWTVDVIK